MQKLNFPFSRKRMRLLIVGISLIAVVAFGLVYAQSLAPTGLNNTGSIKPPIGSVQSPLVMVRDDSVYAAIQQGDNESVLMPIDTIPWGGMWNGSDSYYALNGTCIDLYNNSTQPIYPSWTVNKLPTGCTLTALVCVSQDYYPQPGNIYAKPPTWQGGIVWKSNDPSAFYILPQNIDATFFYKLVWVLTLSTGAVPQDLNFVITINCQE
jgi:hypothetical protein